MLSIPKHEGRFDRFKSIEWWDQARLARSRILVIGAGALGNEVIKNLALLGVGHLVIVDMDQVELSNFSRSVLFRAADEGRNKAECAAESARQIYPEIRARALVGNVMADVGLSYFRWADVVIGALDNREARVFVNAACARVGRPWIDGGIEVLRGVMRGFFAPATACYECTMSRIDWDLLNQRRSCSLLARRAVANQGTPTTPTTASIIAAMQVQEVVKHLHGRRATLGTGYVFDGEEHQSYAVNYRISPDCPWHETPFAIEANPDFGSRTTLQEIWDLSAQRLGKLDAIDFAREIVERMECVQCGHSAPVFCSPEHVKADALKCPTCARECSPIFLHSVPAGSHLLSRTTGELGLPPGDVLWARGGERGMGWEMTADITNLELKYAL